MHPGVCIVVRPWHAMMAFHDTFRNSNAAMVAWSYNLRSCCVA